MTLPDPHWGQTGAAGVRRYAGQELEVWSQPDLGLSPSVWKVDYKGRWWAWEAGKDLRQFVLKT